MIMQKGYEEEKARVAKVRRVSKLCEIISPESITDLPKYCAEEEQTISLCFGYYRASINCPKTCTYAKRMEASKDETKKYEK